MSWNIDIINEGKFSIGTFQGCHIFKLNRGRLTEHYMARQLFREYTDCADVAKVSVYDPYIHGTYMYETCYRCSVTILAWFSVKFTEIFYSVVPMIVLSPAASLDARA